LAAVLGRCVISRLAGSILLCTYIEYMIYLLFFSLQQKLQPVNENYFYLKMNHPGRF